MADHFIDIHCHILPGIDDGSASWDDSLAMARMAADDGIEVIAATPHQLGRFTCNQAETIRYACRQLQTLLDHEGVPIEIQPGADVRIEPNLPSKIRRREVLTIADAGKHVLLELPHDLYLPMEPLLAKLDMIGVVGILTHPERNQGLLRNPRVVETLVEAGCLMQITAGSLMGTFGPKSRDMARWMLESSLVHFVATDAHGTRERRPLIRRAYDHVARISGPAIADRLCSEYPAAAINGDDIPQGRCGAQRWKILSWLGARRKAG